MSPVDAAKEPPALVGQLEVRGESVVLRGAGGTLQLVNHGDWCWGTDASVFHGATVTVKGWPDGNGRLVVEEFAPGSTTDFLHGRVDVAADGRVGIRVRKDKWVELTNPALAEALKSFGGTPERPGTGVILPGPIDAVTTPDGARFTFAGDPEGYYLLTTLRDSNGAVEAEVAHGRRLSIETTAPVRTDYPDSRRFAFGKVRAGAGSEGRHFDAAWVSPPTWTPVWTSPAGTPSPTDSNRSLAAPFSQSPTGLVAFTPPALPSQPPTVFADRAVMKEQSSHAVFFIAGGAKLHIPNPAEFAALGLTGKSIRTVPDRVLAHVPDVPVDGSLLRERGGNGAVFVFENGTKRHITSPERFTERGYDWKNVVDVPNGSLERFAVGPPV